MNTQHATTHPATHAPDERAQIIAALWTWIRQRPGLEYGNYGDPVAYRAELRSITRDLHHARILLRYVEPRASITADMLKAAFRGAFSGRLSWVPTTPDRATLSGNTLRGKEAHLDYCTGQYWPTEYRRAVCAVLASAIWYYWREACMPAPDPQADPNAPRTYRGMSAGDYLRKTALREFGRGIASIWFR